MNHKDKILFGDVFASLHSLENESITLAITSPPYWKQRDYGFSSQIGNEPTAEEYIAKLCTIFDLLRSKLCKKGVFFLNVGDKYLSQYGKSHLLQIPYRLAYHMVKRGWNLIDILIWFKPNHMPTSSRDRFGNTYEPILVFSKSKNNVYNRNSKKVLKINLQQTPWKHTAVFPENLIFELLKKCNLSDGDIVLDPFAGTGTVAKVIKDIKDSLFNKCIYSIMIEKSSEFIKIIKERTKIANVEEIPDFEYSIITIKEEDKFSAKIKPHIINTDKYGEVFIAENSDDFISAIKGITTKEFISYHREDSINFFGVKNWRLPDLYYVHLISKYGYVIRNMLVITDQSGNNWFPVYMFARDSTRVAYRFYLDRVRIEPNYKEFSNYTDANYIGMKVNDNCSKSPKDGVISNIVARYDDNFPKLVVVNWDGHASIELVLHPLEDEKLMEGLQFSCPVCKEILIEAYDPLGKNFCPACGLELWKDINSIPIIKEPDELASIINELNKNEMPPGQIKRISSFGKVKKTRSKFAELDRINWGASPGARKTMMGEYFTKMRLYRIDQPIIAQYLNLIRISSGMTINNIIEKLPPEYYHTVGHWFRKDFGGSIPIPEDVKHLKDIFGQKYPYLDIIERTALKLQTVKNSIKGKNPGDFFEITKNIKELESKLRTLYMPSFYYKRYIGGKKE